MSEISTTVNRIEQARKLNDDLRRNPRFCTYGSVRISADLMCEINARPTRISRLSAQGELLDKLRQWKPECPEHDDPFHQSGGFDWLGQRVHFHIVDESLVHPISDHPEAHLPETWRVISLVPDIDHRNPYRGAGQCGI